MSIDPIYSFAQEITSDYAICDFDGYSLYVNKLPDHIKFEFASIFLSQDEYTESLGIENINFDSKMVPSLIKYLKNNTDKDAQIDFLSTWRDSVVEYYSRKMQEIIDAVCVELNADAGFKYSTQERAWVNPWAA